MWHRSPSPFPCHQLVTSHATCHHRRTFKSRERCHGNARARAHTHTIERTCPCSESISLLSWAQATEPHTPGLLHSRPHCRGEALTDVRTCTPCRRYMSLSKCEFIFVIRIPSQHRQMIRSTSTQHLQTQFQYTHECTDKHFTWIHDLYIRSIVSHVLEPLETGSKRDPLPCAFSVAREMTDPQPLNSLAYDEAQLALELAPWLLCVRESESERKDESVSVCFAEAQHGVVARTAARWCWMAGGQAFVFQMLVCCQATGVQTRGDTHDGKERRTAR